ncbi:MAG TPA: hypothetical protein VM012_09775 [Flavitalea sp.]|nr:hypothetical protein [Flavitalea sp.]
MNSDKNKETEATRNDAKEVSTDLNKAALREAEKDIDKDPDLSIHHPNDDLDEGETARLGEGPNPLI